MHILIEVLIELALIIVFEVTGDRELVMMDGSFIDRASRCENGQTITHFAAVTGKIQGTEVTKPFVISSTKVGTFEQGQVPSDEEIMRMYREQRARGNDCKKSDT